MRADICSNKQGILFTYQELRFIIIKNFLIRIISRSLFTFFLFDISISFAIIIIVITKIEQALTDRSSRFDLTKQFISILC